MERRLVELITTRALVLDDPWVLMHVVLALGPEVQHGGRPALDFVMEGWIEAVTRSGVTYPVFPLAVEAHPNHFLEVLYAVGVPPTRPFATKVGSVTRDGMTAGAKALFSPGVAPSELSWTVSVLTAALPPEADRFETADGRAFTATAIVEAVAQATEAGFADTFAAMRGAKPYGRSALQTYPCNGGHVVGALLDAVRNGYRQNRLAERTRELVGATIFRLSEEVRLIDRVLGASTEPLAKLNADAAKLQFLGHALAAVRFARRHGLYEASAADEQSIAAAETELGGVVERIAGSHDLDALKRQVPRAYSLLLGDACHALDALHGGTV